MSRHSANAHDAPDIRPRLTEIADECLEVPGHQGPRAYYASDGQEESTHWVGPRASVAEALADYLEEHYPADDEEVEVTLGRPLRFPRLGGFSDYFINATCDEDWPEGAVDAVSNCLDKSGKDSECALDEAVTAFVHNWFRERGLESAIDGYWRGYGRTLETTAGAVRAWLAALEARPVSESQPTAENKE